MMKKEFLVMGEKKRALENCELESSSQNQEQTLVGRSPSQEEEPSHNLWGKNKVYGWPPNGMLH